MMHWALSHIVSINHFIKHDKFYTQVVRVDATVENMPETSVDPDDDNIIIENEVIILTFTIDSIDGLLTESHFPDFTEFS